MGILREPIKILSRNGKLIASITLFSLFPYSLLFLGNHFSIRQLIFNLVMNMFFLPTNEPGSLEYLQVVREIKEGVGYLVVMELFFTVYLWVVSLSSMVSTVYFKKLVPKELLFRIAWVTWFCASFMSVGCTLLILAMIGLLTVAANSSIALVPLALLVSILVLGVYLYLYLVWIVGLLVPALEDGCYGLEALGKAREIIKGIKLQGCILTYVLALVLTIISGFLGYEMADSITPDVQFALALVLTNIICLWKIYSLMVYTVLYYKCEKSHGEEVEMQFVLHYIVLPTIPLVSEALP